MQMIEQLESMLAVLPASMQSGVLASNSVVKKVGNLYEIWAGVLLFSGTFNEAKSYIDEQVYRYSLQF